MLIECPNCRERMRLMADGRCPACGEHPERPCAEDREGRLCVTSVVLYEGQALPDCCVYCGRPASVRRRIVRKRARARRREDAGLMPVMFGAEDLYALGCWIERIFRRPQVVELALPFCARCAKVGLPKPEHVDFEAGSMRFTVHTEFAANLGHWADTTR